MNTAYRFVRRTAAHPCVLALAGSALLGGAALGLGAFQRVSADGNTRTAPHGALPMAEQIKELTPWLTPTVGTPQGVSPAYFSAIAPKHSPKDALIVALGKRLFFDMRLSRDGTVACATCHDVSRGFADLRGTSEGIEDKLGRRNAPTTMNALFYQSQFWDGRAATLEDQAKLPILNPIEMGQPDEAAAMASIAGDASYEKEFREAFGRAPNFEDLAKAIATFERTMVFLDAPFDRFARGDVNAISEDAKAGFALYNGKARCTGCHQISSGNPIGTDNRFHNIGVSARHQDFEGLVQKALKAIGKDSSPEMLDKLALETDLSELGRFIVTRNRSEIGAFKTPQVRNVGVTAPYMHDGSLSTLWDVMDHYNKGGEANPFLDGGMEPLNLNEREIEQVVAFLFSLTDDRLRAQNAAEEQRQRGLANKQRPLRNEALATRKVFLFETRSSGAAKEPR